MSSNEPLAITSLEYRMFTPVTRTPGGDPILQMHGMVNMIDYHLRRNAENSGVDPLTIKTRIDWGEGTFGFVIEGPPSEETLSFAFDKAAQLIGLQAERIG